MGGWSGGVYTRFRNWVTDKANSINPQAALFDQEDDGFAAGLNNCVTKDGLNKPASAMDWNGQNLTGVLNFANTGTVSLANGKMTISVNGNVIVNAPISGVALAVTSVGGGAAAATLNAPSGSDLFTSWQANTTQFGIIGVAGNVNGLIGGSTIGDFCIRNVSQSLIFSGNNGTSVGLKITIANLVQAVDQGGTLQDVGWRDLPFNDQAGNYTFALSDRGKMMRFFGGGGITYTIPANASIAFPIGTVIDITNQGGASLTIAITTDTLAWPGGGGATGSRILATTNSATIKKVSSTGWWIAGSGIT